LCSLAQNPQLDFNLYGKVKTIDVPEGRMLDEGFEVSSKMIEVIVPFSLIPILLGHASPSLTCPLGSMRAKM